MDDRRGRTILRDDQGRLLPGTGKLNDQPVPRNGGRGGRGLTFRMLCRRRFRDGPEGAREAEELFDRVRDIALNRVTKPVLVPVADDPSSGPVWREVPDDVPPKVQLDAAVTLMRMLDGKKLFDHMGEGEVIDTKGVSTGRTYDSPEGMLAKRAQVAEVLGCQPEEVTEVLEAALEMKRAQEAKDG